MRILFACHRLPFPPKRGGKIRPFNIIRHMAESGHDVTVATIARSTEELEEGRGLVDYCGKLHVGVVGRVNAAIHTVGRIATTTPSSMGYFYSPDLHRQVKQTLQRDHFDLIFVHCSSAAQYVRAANGIPSIIDFGDMDSRKWLDYGSFKPFPLSLGYRLESIKLGREEKRLARHFDLSTCTTRAELETLQSFNAASRSDWFPNGVDSDFFSKSNAAYNSNTICFVGRMDYFPNQQAMLAFCADVLPLIQARRPGTRLTIVGAEPSRKIRELAERPGVTVTGTVADVRDHVRNAAVSVAPLMIARGTQNKILESMSMGVPVVCSTLAADGVDAKPGRHLLTAASPNEYATAIIRLLDDADERERLAEAGRNRVLTHHSWSTSMRKMDSIVRSVVGEEC